MNAKVGVVILTYNSEDFIEACIRSVQKNIYENFQIVVVDNISKDKTVAKVKKSFPTIPVIQTGKNLGYAGGNNIGIEYFLKQKCDYILLLNPDTLVEKQLLTKLVAIAKKDTAIGVIGPIITYVADPQMIWFAGGYFNTFFCYTRHPHMGEALSRVNVSSGEVDFITGACFMIRTAILKQTGLLPSRYFLYFEDSFFCRKVREKGYKSYLLAEPLVHHYVSASTGKIGMNTMTPLRAYYFARNPLWYIRREVKGPLKIPNFLGQFLIRAPHYFLQMLRDRDKKAFAAYLQGINDGLRK